MKIISTFTLTRAQALERLKRLCDSDKRKHQRDGRSHSGKLSAEQRAHVKGVFRSIKEVNKHLSRKSDKKAK